MTITTTTVTVAKRNGTTKTVESPYTDREALMRLYDLTGYELTGPHGRELVWHDPKITSSFARSLVTQNEMNGRQLSAKQMAWVHIIVIEHESPLPDPGAQDAPRLTQVRAMLDEAAETLKTPKVNLTTADGQRVRLGRAGERARIPGVIHITDGGPYGANTYFGSIQLDGTLRPSQAMTPEVETLLFAFDRDPQAVARAYGHNTGSCCFCSRELTDGRSVAMGYGPICAGKFSLPWGEERASSMVEIHAEEV